MSYKGRSSWKGFNYLIFNKFYCKKNLKYLKKSKTIKLFVKNYVLSDFDINKKYFIYNGKYFNLFFFSKLAINYKIGQFLLTKKMGKIIHLQEKRNKKKQKVKRK